MEVIYSPRHRTVTLRADGREVTIGNVRTAQEAVHFAAECGFTGTEPTEIVAQ